MGLFNKKIKTEKIKNGNKITASEKIHFLQVNDSSDEMLFDICAKILDGTPVLANFENLDIKESNNMLAFISGVLYAIEGTSLKVQSKLFLFARKEEFEDGSLYQYYEDLK